MICELDSAEYITNVHVKSKKIYSKNGMYSVLDFKFNTFILVYYSHNFYNEKRSLDATIQVKIT